MAESRGDLRRVGWGSPGHLCLSFLGYLLVPNMGSELQIPARLGSEVSKDPGNRVLSE